MMWDGKKSVAEGIIYKALDKIKERSQEDPLKVFKKAIENLQPKVEVKSKRVGGANYQVPVESTPPAASPWRCAGWWLTRATVARRRWSINSPPRLWTPRRARERGQKREDVHRMAEANKAFAHYRW